MTFLRPDLLALAPASALLLMVSAVALWRRRTRLVDAFGGPLASWRLTGRRLERFPALGLTLSVAAVILLVLAAAGPVREAGAPVEPPTPVDLVVALDVSHSMTARDVGAARIERAQALVARLASERAADRIGLVLFADRPYGLVPLTDDRAVIDFFAPWVRPELVAMRSQGTSLDATVEEAFAAWEERPREGAEPILLIVTDGETHGRRAEVMESVGRAADAGIEVWTAGVGTPDGAPLFVPGSEDAPLLDASGAPAVAGYDEELLREMAEAGSGRFHDVSDDAAIARLVDALHPARTATDPESEAAGDFVPWLVLLAMTFLLVEAFLDAGRLGVTRAPRMAAASTSAGGTGTAFRSRGERAP